MSGARVGNGNFPLDPGGVIRRVAYEVDDLKSFSLVTAERATGKTISQGGLRHASDSTWIDYAGPAGDDQAVLVLRRATSAMSPRARFKDKIVIVGPSAVTLQDIHPTSTDNAMSGAEIQANAQWRPRCETLSDQQHPVLGHAGADRPVRHDWRRSPACACRFCGCSRWRSDQPRCSSSPRSWRSRRASCVTFVYPFGTLLVSSVGSLAAHYLLAAFERERVRDVFSRFVPDAVVEQVLAQTDGDLRLGGVALEGTCMFTDVRGFTTFSETLTAAEVIEILNVYLSEMSEAILNNGGTLVAYMGDGIFAVFGAPIEQPDHADRALAAGREMLTTRLPHFNALMEERGLPARFKMGVGLNSGPFMSGNVGHERRLEYTAIGDTTNTASRLEGMTKGQPYVLFMSDTTKEALTKEVPDIVFVDEFEVRGRQEPVKIWSIEDAAAEGFEAPATDREPEPDTTARP